MNFEKWGKPRFLLKVCLWLGALMGAVVGGELMAGLGAGGLLLGWLAGGMFGAALGFSAARSQYRGLAHDDSAVCPRAMRCQREEHTCEPAIPAGSHVQRLQEERKRQEIESREL
ncbi:MAG: hypothetical protein HY299_02770 [Verrucomicrobia bacterium]|nr:hypothetical protein [Verrucomicrobiota bacterium]